MSFSQRWFNVYKGCVNTSFLPSSVVDLLDHCTSTWPSCLPDSCISSVWMNASFLAVLLNNCTKAWASLPSIFVWYKHFLFAKLCGWPSQPLRTLAWPVVLVVFAEPHYLHPQHLCDIPFCLALWLPFSATAQEQVWHVFFLLELYHFYPCVLANGSCLLSLSGHGTRAWLALATCGNHAILHHQCLCDTHVLTCSSIPRSIFSSSFYLGTELMSPWEGNKRKWAPNHEMCLTVNCGFDQVCFI